MCAIFGSYSIDKLKELYPNLSSNLLNHLLYYLQTYSGGHGRTIEKIVKEVLSKPSIYDIEDYNEFETLLSEEIEEILANSQLNDEKMNEIRKLQSEERFNVVHQWFLTSQGCTFVSHCERTIFIPCHIPVNLMSCTSDAIYLINLQMLLYFNT